jgi:hypothetical protein
MELISYKIISETYKIGDSFYDKYLNKYTVFLKYKEHDDEVIIYEDENGKKFNVHFLTRGSRLLLSLGINKIKISIYWDKRLFYTEKQGNMLKRIKKIKILEEYNQIMKDGLESGIITQEEYDNPKLLKN